MPFGTVLGRAAFDCILPEAVADAYNLSSQHRRRGVVEGLIALDRLRSNSTTPTLLESILDVQHAREIVAALMPELSG